jgi:hypothetical protein
MMAYNLSNPDRPDANAEMAKIAAAIAKEALSEFDSSHLMSCRVYTVFGTTWI